jgi:hypothetical protein
MVMAPWNSSMGSRMVRKVAEETGISITISATSLNSSVRVVRSSQSAARPISTPTTASTTV